MSKPYFIPFFHVGVTEDTEGWLVTIGRQQIRIQSKATAYAQGLVTVSSAHGASELLSACFRGHLAAGICARHLCLPPVPHFHYWEDHDPADRNEHGQPVDRNALRAKKKSDVLTKVLAKALPEFPVAPNVREIHRLLFSVRGVPPSSQNLRFALALPHPEDLRFHVIRFLVSHRMPGNQSCDLLDHILCRPLRRRFSRKLAYRFPGGLPFNVLVRVIFLAEEGLLTSYPPSRLHWIALAGANEVGERNKEAVQLIMRSTVPQILLAVQVSTGCPGPYRIPRKHAAVSDLAYQVEHMLHEGPLHSLLEQATIRRQYLERPHAWATPEPHEWWLAYKAPEGLTFPALTRELPPGWEYLDTS